MGAQENKQSAQEAYAAFANGDAEGAMRDIDDSIEWTVRGDNALTGVHRGKQEVGELWGRYLEQSPETEIHEMVAEGDKVVVLNTVRAGGEEVTGADVLTYNDSGKLIAFDTLADETVTNRLYPK
jgi:ketosteroid isomerase-like protein